MSKPWHHVAVKVDESEKLAQCVRVGRNGPISNELESVMKWFDRSWRNCEAKVVDLGGGKTALRK